MGSASGIRTVLVVDDDEPLLRAYECALATRVRVLTATTKLAATALAHEHHPELAIVDLQLGSESGLDVLRELRAALPAMRVVIVSGYGTVESTVWAMRAGADDVVEKPVTFAEIVHRIDGASEPSSFEPISADRARWEHVHRVLRECGGNLSMTARKLGVYRTTLRRWLQKNPPRA